MRETLERDLRYWRVQHGRAEIAKPPSDGTVAFGARVTIVRRAAPAYERGRKQTFRIVGEDEADPAHGTVSHVSPLARALFGKAVGDTVEVAKSQAEIVEIA